MGYIKEKLNWLSESFAFKLLTNCIFVPLILVYLCVFIEVNFHIGSYIIHYTEQMQICGSECSTLGILLSAMFAWLGCLAVTVALVFPPKGFWLCFLLIVWGILAGVCLVGIFKYAINPSQSAYSIGDVTYAKHICYSILIGLWALLGVGQVYLPKRVRRYVISVHTMVSVCCVLFCTGPYAQ